MNDAEHTREQMTRWLESVVQLNRLETDQKTVAEREWQAGLKPKAEQKACDAGLFSDDSKQTKMFK